MTTTRKNSQSDRSEKLKDNSEEITNKVCNLSVRFVNA